MNEMLEPWEVFITTQRHGVKKYICSMFPATVGREIVTQYPISATPKVGSYDVNEALMLKLMSYVAVEIPVEGGITTKLRLTTRALIDSHIPDYETLMKLEFAMMEGNTSFFTSGKASEVFQSLIDKLQASVFKMLTQWSERSSTKG